MVSAFVFRAFGLGIIITEEQLEEINKQERGLHTKMRRQLLTY